MLAEVVVSSIIFFTFDSTLAYRFDFLSFNELLVILCILYDAEDDDRGPHVVMNLVLLNDPPLAPSPAE